MRLPLSYLLLSEPQLCRKLRAGPSQIRFESIDALRSHSRYRAGNAQGSDGLAGRSPNRDRYATHADGVLFPIFGYTRPPDYRQFGEQALKIGYRFRSQLTESWIAAIAAEHITLRQVGQ